MRSEARGSSACKPLQEIKSIVAWHGTRCGETVNRTIAHRGRLTRRAIIFHFGVGDCGTSRFFDKTSSPYVSTILQLPTDFTTSLHVPFIKLPRENTADVSGLVLIVVSRTRRHLSGLPCLPKLESTYEIVTESGQSAQGEGEGEIVNSRPAGRAKWFQFTPTAELCERIRIVNILSSRG
ncbi:hypothetical protein K0M31_000491 [Melipona bicolor]|uniref:Uncharacterized protein n=1 Tax=Melipona bicolor TaxID=60889 RepID=A0AA40KWQ4_9HYME|nr:hypothetical protein K0M31_000491 [Melipona bicolor]